MKTGLVSVTFRQHSADEIIAMAVKAGIDGIEWGGDIHCKPGDLSEAKRISALMEKNNLLTISYGSYYKIGIDSDFLSVLDTAKALHAPNIRVWAGNIGSESVTEDYRRDAVTDAKRIADISKKENITISFEFHAGTITDTLASTMQLLCDVACDNVYTYWQPPIGRSFEENLSDIKALKSIGKIMNIHVFCWYPNSERQPLEIAQKQWREYIKAAESNACLLEFVKDDSDIQFFKDAESLKNLFIDIA